MALLDWIAPESGLRVEGEGVRLRPPRASDYTEWRDLRAQSRAFLQPWEPTWPVDDLGRAAHGRAPAAGPAAEPGRRRGALALATQFPPILLARQRAVRVVKRR